MKLISVQSRGNRLVRIVCNELGLIRYDIYGKTIGYTKSVGMTNRAELIDFAFRKRAALKAAELWLRGATV